MHPKAGTDESHHCLSPQASHGVTRTHHPVETPSGAFFIACSEGFTHQQAVFFGSLGRGAVSSCVVLCQAETAQIFKKWSSRWNYGMAIQVEGVLLWSFWSAAIGTFSFQPWHLDEDLDGRLEKRREKGLPTPTDYNKHQAATKIQAQLWEQMGFSENGKTPPFFHPFIHWLISFSPFNCHFGGFYKGYTLCLTHPDSCDVLASHSRWRRWSLQILTTKWFLKLSASYDNMGMGQNL